MRKTRTAILAFLCLFSLLSCSNISGPDSGSYYENQNQTSSKITLNGRVNTSVAAGALPSAFINTSNNNSSQGERSASYSVPTSFDYFARATNRVTGEVVGDQDGECTWMGNDSDKTFAMVLDHGIWDVEAGICLDGSGPNPAPSYIIYTSGLQEIDLPENAPLVYTANFRPRPRMTDDGAGDIGLTITKPDSVDIVTSKLLMGDSTAWGGAGFDSEENVDNQTVIGNNVYLSASAIKSGSYTVQFRFYDCDEYNPSQDAEEMISTGKAILVYSTIQTINVFDNLTTDFWRRTADDPNSPVNASDGTFELDDDIIRHFSRNRIYVSESGSDSNSGTAYQPYASLNKAISYIDSQGSSTDNFTITVSGNVHSSAVINTTASHAASITIEGKDGSTTDILNGGNNYRVLKINSTVPVTLRIIQLTGGLASDGEGGGGILVKGSNASNQAKLFIEDGTLIKGNEISATDANGMGLFAEYAEVEMNGGEISGHNDTSTNTIHGSVALSHSKFTLNEGEIKGNRIERAGNANAAGIWVDNASTLEMTNGTISGNRVSVTGDGNKAAGAAVYLKNGCTFKMSGGEIKDNAVSGPSACGGSVYVSPTASFEMSDSAIIYYGAKNASNVTEKGVGKNDIYLERDSSDATKQATVKITSVSLSTTFEGGKVAAVTLSDWKRGGRFLSADNETNLNNNKNKYILTYNDADDRGWERWNDTSSSTKYVTINSPVYVASTGADPTRIKCTDSASVADADRNGILSRPFRTLEAAINYISDSTSDAYAGSGNHAEIIIDGTLKDEQQKLPATFTTDKAASLTIRGYKANPDDTTTTSAATIMRYSSVPVSAQTSGTALYISSTVPVTIEDLKITGGMTSQQGGGIFLGTGTSLKLGNGAWVTGNSAGISGGGIYLVSGSKLFMYGSSLVGDLTEATAADANLTTSGTTGCSNTAPVGGGICSWGGKVYIGYSDESTPCDMKAGYGVRRNFASGVSGYNAGGIANRSGILKISSGSISYNQSANNGGGIYSKGETGESRGDILIEAPLDSSNELVMYGNKAAIGGAIYVGSLCTLTMEAGKIGGNGSGQQNIATDSGGAIYQGDTFCVSGSALIYPGSVSETEKTNDVYLPQPNAGKVFLVTAGSINSNGNTSTLKMSLSPELYKRGSKIVQADGAGVTVDSIKDKFQLTEDDEDWNKFEKTEGTYADVKKYVAINADVYVAGTNRKTCGQAGKTAAAGATGTKGKPFSTIAEALSVFEDSTSPAVVTIDGEVSGGQTVGGEGVTISASEIKLNGYTYTEGGVTKSSAKLNGAFNSYNPGTTLSINSALLVTLSDLEVTGGYSSGNGGGIRITNESAKVNLNNVAVTGNYAAGTGGGIFISSDFAMIGLTGNTIIGKNTNTPSGADTAITTGINKANAGGGIHNSGSLYLGARITSGGGAQLDSDTDLTGGIYGNVAVTNGGGIYGSGLIYAGLQGGSSPSNGGNIKYNYASSGGGIYIEGGKIAEINKAIFEQNNAGTSGGAVYNAGTLKLRSQANLYAASNDVKVNDVYLASGKTVTVTGDFDSSITKVATITLGDWKRGTKYLSASTSNSSVISPETTAAASARKFTLSEGDTDWDREAITTGAGETAVSYILINSPVYVASTAESDSTRKACEKGISIADGALGTKSKPCSSIADAISMFEDPIPAIITIDGTLSQGQTISGTINASQVTIQGYEYVEGGVTKHSGILDGGDTDGQSMLTVIASSTSFPVIIKNLKITGGRRTWGGGIYIDQGTVVLTDGAVVTGNYATYGGGVYINNDGRLLMNGKSLIGDDPKSNTTAIYSSTDSSKYANNANNGGGIYCKGELYIGYTLYGSAIISDTMTSNATDGYFGVCRNNAEQGGGIYYSDGTLSIYNGNISNNRSTGDGGALYIGKNGGTIKGGNIKNNSANCGGAIYVSGSKTIDLLGSTPLEISGNYVEATATSNNTEINKQGGAIFNNGTLNIKGQTKINNNHISLASTAYGNVIAGQGGAIYNHGTGTVNIADAEGLTNSIEIKNNYVSITISGASSENNDAYARGGAIYTLGNVNISSAADISGNHATTSGSNFDTTDVYSYGGAIYMETTDVTISADAKFDGNSATAASAFNAECAVGKGGAFYNVGGTITMSKGKLGTVSANTATTAGGAIVQNGYFNVSGDAFFTPGNEKSNDIYLPDAYFITVAGAITDDGNTSTNPMMITPELWFRSAEVIEAGAGLSGGLTDALLARFTTTDPDMGVYLYEGTGILEGDIYIAKEEAQTIDGVYYGAGASVILGGRGTRAKPYSTLDTALDQCWNGPKDTVVTEGVTIGRTVYVIGDVTGAQSILDAFTTDEASAVLLKGATTGAKLKGGFDSTNEGTTLTINTAVPVTIQDLTITGGYRTNSSPNTVGGGMTIAEGATVKLADGAVVTGNTGYYGGGINNQGTLYIYGTARVGGTGTGAATTTSGNLSDTYGGGIHNTATGKVYIGYSEFTDLDNCKEETTTGGVTRNYSKSMGGGISNLGTLYMRAGEISNNKVYKSNGGYGGGIYNVANVILYGGEMKGNSASLSESSGQTGGGAIYQAGTLKLGLGISIPGTGARNTNDIAFHQSSNVTIDRGPLTGEGVIWLTGNQIYFYRTSPSGFPALSETTSGLIAANYTRFGACAYQYTSSGYTYGPGWMISDNGLVYRADLIRSSNYSSFTIENNKGYNFVIDPSMTDAQIKAFISRMTCTDTGYNTTNIAITSSSILDLSRTSITSLTVEGDEDHQKVQSFKKVILPATMNENSFNTPEKNWAFADVKEYVVPPNSTSLCTVNGVVYNKDKTVLVKYPSAKTDTSFTVPETVTAIAPGAFYHAKHLRTISLNNVNTFGALSFAESQIESIIIPAGLTEVPEQCFAHCWSLVSVSFADDTCETIGSKAFYDNYDLRIVALPDSLTTIGSQAFASSFQNTFNKTLTIPGSVNIIGKGAFAECPSTTLTLSFENTYGWQYSIDDGSDWWDISESTMSDTSFFTSGDRQFRRQ